MLFTPFLPFLPPNRALMFCLWIKFFYFKTRLGCYLLFCLWMWFCLGLIIDVWCWIWEEDGVWFWREERANEKERRKREKFRGIKKYEREYFKKLYLLYHSTTVPSYIYDGTIALWQNFLLVYMFSILTVDTVFCPPSIYMSDPKKSKDTICSPWGRENN